MSQFMPANVCGAADSKGASTSTCGHKVAPTKLCTAPNQLKGKLKTPLTQLGVAQHCISHPEVMTQQQHKHYSFYSGQH